MHQNADIRSHALYLFKKNFPLILFQIVVLSSIAFFQSLYELQHPTANPWVSLGVTFLISIVTHLVFTYGFAYICLCFWREESFKFSDYFRFLKSPKLIFTGIATAVIYQILVFFAMILPMLFSIFPLGAFFQLVVMFGALAVGVSCTCSFAMVQFLFAQGKSNSVLDLFFSSSEAMKGEKWDYFKFIIGTQLVPFIIATIFVFALQLFFPANTPLFFIPSIISSILSVSITIFATIASAGYLNNKLEEYKD